MISAPSRTAFFAKLAAIGVFCSALAACTLAGPPPAHYVLGTPITVTAGTVSERGMPILYVERVIIPDYLDTTDLNRRDGNRLLPSTTGRWDERLSSGIRRALTASLTTRLPRFTVTETLPLDQPTRRLLVDVTDFGTDVPGAVTLMARWSITDGSGQKVLTSKRTVVTEALPNATDQALVAAMTAAIDALALQIAAALP